MHLCHYSPLVANLNYEWCVLKKIIEEKSDPGGLFTLWNGENHFFIANILTYLSLLYTVLAKYLLRCWYFTNLETHETS